MRCGLLGRKLGHSWSPAIHGFLGDYSYDLFEKEPEQVEDLVKNGDWDGLNVTIPYKKTVLPFCDLLTPLAQELGSVNTLVRLGDGRIMGDNTDATGFDRLLGSVGVSCQGKKALVLGSGGASATAQAILKLAGARVIVISRTGEDNYENLDRHADAQILVNTTPVGMYPNNGERPVSLDRLPHLEAVLDLIYNPAKTRLILDAEERGIPCRSGLLMLVAQAVSAAEMWTGREISEEKTEEVCQVLGASMENIVLIGMPGCGKTTVGKRLAKMGNRPFFDADEVLTEKIGPIPDFIRTRGEDAFREAEHEVLKELGKQSGVVLATGGGCVTRPENRDVLRQNGKVVWLRRPIEDLPTEGRPLSQKEGAAALYEKRKALYEQFADFGVDSTGDPTETARIICGKGE